MIGLNRLDCHLTPTNLFLKINPASKSNHNRLMRSKLKGFSDFLGKWTNRFKIS